MNKLITTADGGMPFNLDDLRWIFGQSASDAGIYQVLNKMLLPLGTDFIVTGCLSGIIGVGSVSEGLIMLDSELIWVDAHTATSTNFVKVESFDGNGLKTYRDESTADTYKKIRATVSSSSGGFALVGAGTYTSLTQNINEYFKQNYDSGATTQGAAGVTHLGKNDALKILASGAITMLSTLATAGAITATTGDITATVGDIVATAGHFDGENAPKLAVSTFTDNTGITITNFGLKDLVTANVTTGVYICSLPETIAGVVMFSSNAYVIDAGVFIQCNISVYKINTTQFGFIVTYDDGTGIPTPSSTLGVYAQITAYW